MLNITRLILSVGLLAAVAYLTFELVKESQSRQQVVLENAEIKNIKYGLLSIYAWKRQISDIVAKRVKEFELTVENREELGEGIQKAMHKLLDEVEKALEEKRNEGGWFQRAIGSLVQSMVFDIEDLRRRVPEFTEIMLDELDNYETREKLRLYIQNKVEELLYETVGEEDLSNIAVLEKQYDCTGIPECSTIIDAKLKKADEALAKKGRIIVGLSTLIFFIILIGNRHYTNPQIWVLIGLCAVLLTGGVATPMIDIDARIENFEFTFMGEQLGFNDQLLFFQSKSIFEVVRILTTTGEYQSVAVGILIFAFSIIFPFLKLTSSAALAQKPALGNIKPLRFFALKSGKWSMADVMVVAIFMSYIGFKGVIGSQLRQLQDIGQNIEVLTTDESSLGIGFILFLSFCLGGLILATVLERKVGSEQVA